MNDKLFDALEICLQALEQGETIDSVLTRFPALADELRPILEASLQARTLAGAPVSDIAHRRGRAKLLQRAAELREAKRAPRRRTWLFTFRPAAVTLVLAVFLLTSTGLVRASTATLPGDNLYPVKRTWEDLTFLFIAREDHDTLELAYETERVEEVNELLAEGREETVSFSGYVNSQVDGQWNVAGVPVRVTNTTILPGLPIEVGAPIMVTGYTDAQGFLVAESIETVEPGSIVPDIEDDDGNGEDEQEGDEESDSSSSKDAGVVVAKETEISITKVEGLVQAVSGKIWLINDQRVDVSRVLSSGEIAPGSNVIVEGYYASDGTFVAVKITFVNSAGESGSGSADGNGNDGLNGNGDDGNDDDSNDNDDNENSNDGNDNGGGGNDND